MAERSKEREEFLKDVLITAVESSPYTPWFAFEDYKPSEGTVTVWHDPDEEGTYEDGPYHIDIDKIAMALAKFQMKVMALPDPQKSYGWEMVLASRTNGEDGDFDVTTADAVMQIAVLGEERYS